MRHLLLILAVSVASCSPPSETLSAFDASGREALRFKKGAGPIVSTAQAVAAARVAGRLLSFSGRKIPRSGGAYGI